MGRRPCCAKEGLNRGAWTAREDKILINHIKVNGEGHWRDLPQKAGLKRCGKSCRLRWLNYLRPDIKRGNISTEEEELIVRLHKLLGNRWSLIAGRLPGRTDNEIKNYWNTNLSKKTVQGDKKNPQCPKEKNVDTNPAKQKSDNLKHEVGDNNNYHRPHQVIRTKAVRCTGVVNIVPRRPLPLDVVNNISNDSSSPEGYVNSTGGSPSEDNYNSNNSNSSGVLLGDDDDDLLMNFDISDLLVPDCPGSNLVQAGNNYEMAIGGNNNYWEENGGVLTLEAEANYRQRNGVDLLVEDAAGSRPMGGFDFESLEKFLGSEEEEW